MSQASTKIKKFFKGFGYAFEGIKESTQERNMKVHLVISLLVIIAGLWLSLPQNFWIIIGILIALVLSAELFNSAIEDLCNLMRESSSLDYKATKKARDLAAGAVLILSIMAAIIGLVIFTDRLSEIRASGGCSCLQPDKFSNKR